MIVGNKHGHDLAKCQTILAKHLLDGTHRYAGIDQNGVLVGAKIVAVAAASARKTQELQH
jgi:hypothetical protein